MQKTLRRAIAIGLIQAVWLLGGFTLLTHLLPAAPHASLRATTGLVGMAVLFGGILHAMQRARAETQGPISYWGALRVGLLVALVVAAIVSLASLFYVTVLAPGFRAEMIAEAAAGAQAANRSPAEVEAARAVASREFSTAAQVLMPLVAQSLAGLVFSLLLAIFFRRKG